MILCLFCLIAKRGVSHIRMSRIWGFTGLLFWCNPVINSSNACLTVLLSFWVLAKNLGDSSLSFGMTTGVLSNLFFRFISGCDWLIDGLILCLFFVRIRMSRMKGFTGCYWLTFCWYQNWKRLNNDLIYVYHLFLNKINHPVDPIILVILIWLTPRFAIRQKDTKSNHKFKNYIL